jgi:hypothetical protein
MDGRVSVSGGRILILLTLENLLDVLLPVENAHDAQRITVDSVEDENVLEILHRPGTQFVRVGFLDALGAPI